MTTVEGLFHKYSSPSESQQLCDELAPFLVQSRSPAPVKCTKRLYNCFVSSFDEALAKPNGYETVCVLLNTLCYISNGSPALSNGFVKFVSFGLLEKITLKLKSQPGWSKAADEILFTLTVIMNHSSEVKRNMIPMLPTLLMYASHQNLPCSAKIEVVRGCNTLLEESSVEHRCTLSTKPQIKKLIQEMGNLIVKAGDIELQVTMVECLFRLTSIKERNSLGQKWFRSNHALLKAFSGLRDSEFEVDCRGFLNLLNVSVGNNRTVYSLPCKRAFLGTFELHRPADPGVEQFWVDFNLASQTIAIFVEDPYTSGSNNPEDNMWEYVIIRREAIKRWTIEDKENDFCLTLETIDLVHSLLPDLSDDSHTIVITFGHSFNPSHPCELVFGPAKALQHKAQRDPKQSRAIAPIHINEKRQTFKPTQSTSGTIDSAWKNNHNNTSAASRQHSTMQEISPIELPPSTPATGGHVNSQEAGVTPDQDMLPNPTPATSTPKPHPLLSSAPKHTPSSTLSRGAVRPSLIFSSGGEPQSASRKASLAVNTVVLGSKSRVVTTAEKELVKTARATQNVLEGISGMRSEMVNEQARITRNSNVPANKQQRSETETGRANVKPKASSRSGEQAKIGNESENLDVNRVESRTRQASKLSTKKKQKQTTVAKKSAPPAATTKAAQSKVKSITHNSTSHCATIDPMLHQQSAPHTTTEPCAAPKSISNDRRVSGRNKPAANKVVSKFPASPDPYDIDISPIIDYKMPCSKVQEKLTSTRRTKNTSTKSSSNRSFNTSKPALLDITNHSTSSAGTTQLNKGGKVRVFNLSAAPLKGRKKGRGKLGKNSTASSLNSSICSESELNAIPDSLPLAPIGLKSTPYNSFLDDELEFKPPPPPAKQRKRIQMPTNHDTFSFDSENDSDGSWKLAFDAKKNKKEKEAASKPPTKRQYKTRKSKETSRPALTSARTKKSTTAKKVEESVNTFTDYCNKTASKLSRKLSTVPDNDCDDEIVSNKMRALTSVSLLGRKRVIDDVYDPDYTPEVSHPSTRDILAAAKKPLPKRRAASSAAAKAAMEEPAKETPSLPSYKKDTAVRKLVMMEKSPKPSKAKSRVGAVLTEGKKKASSAGERRKKQSIGLEVSPCVQDEFCDSPAIPRLSASKPDLAERAQSPSKQKSLHELPSPKLDPYNYYEDDVVLICPPSPKKPRLKQSRRSSGYFSDLKEEVQNSPSNSYHSSLEELHCKAKSNLQFEDDELERSPASSLQPPPPPSHDPTPTAATPSPSPSVSLHSSHVEADLNITSGFEQICRDFIARSGRKAHQPPPAKAQKQSGVKRKAQSESNAPVAKKKRKRRQEESYWENREEEVLDSPPLPPRVHQRTKKQPNNKTLLPVKKTTNLKKKKQPVSKPVPVSDVESSAYETDSNEDENNTSDEDEVSVRPIANEKKIAMSKQTSSELVDFSSEMQALVCSFQDGLNRVVKSRKVNTKQLASKATRGELLKLWVAHQKQRTDMSTLFHSQLCREIEALEREVKSTQGSEEKVSSHLKVCFKTIAKSLHKQQSQVDRLRALQVTYQEQVERLEQEQEKQRVTAQKSLKKEMHSLQKRLLEDSQKQEVARIKKTLHTMLMQL